MENKEGSNPLSGLSKYWQVIVGVFVFTLTVGGYIQKQKYDDKDTENSNIKIEQHFSKIEKEVADQNERNDKEQKEIKEQVYKELEQRVDDLEELAAYEKGYKEGYQKALNDKKK